MSTQSPEQPHDGQGHNDSRPRPDLARMNIAMLVWHCAAENQHFYHSQPSDSSYAYELFRRALIERDEVAWTYLYDLYCGVVRRWVRKNAAFESSGELIDTLVGEAFARFWHAIPPARFEQFPSTNSLLHYLQRCANCAVIDSARAAARLSSAEVVLLSDTRQRTPDEVVLERMLSEELWRHIAGQLNGEAERVVVFDSFVSGLKPRDICARRRDLFASVQEVYSVKHNVLARLSRDQGLRQMLW